MIKQATRNLFIKILIVVLAVSCLFGLNSFNSNKLQTVYSALETAQEVKDSYMIGETFTIPDGEVVDGDNRYTAQESLLVFPGGKASQAKTQTLSEKGEYKLVYTATVENEKFVAEKKFSVVDAYYSLVGEGAKNSSFALVDDFTMAPEQGLSGVKTAIGKNTTLVVNEVFDASVLTKGTPVATIYPYNNTHLFNKSHGYVEVFDIQVVLTDYYDPTNYIIIEYHWLDNFANYVGEPLATQEKAPELNYMVSTKGSSFPIYYGTFTGIRRSDVWLNAEGQRLDDPVRSYKKDDEGNDVINPLWTGNNLPEGATYSHSYGLSVYFDYETFTVYGDAMNETTKVISPKLVSNLGATNKYGEKAFTGFTNGKFTISFRANDYKPQTGKADSELLCNMEISNILGKTGEQLQPVAMPKDTTAPYIVIEGGNNKVVVAKGEQVKIPEVKVSDADLKSVISQVYYGYGTQQETLVAIENGKFTPKRVGYYTVLYTAEDHFGNVSTKTIDIEAKIFPNNQSLTLQYDKVENVQAGTVLELPLHTLVGESIDKFVKVYYAYDGGEKVEITDTLSFFVEHVGKYKIYYEYYNLLSTYEAEYEVESVASTAVTFTQAFLPKYFIKGLVQTLEGYSAYRYVETNPTAAVPAVFVSEDGGAWTEIDGKAYTVGANETVQFKYVLDGAEELSAVVPVVDVKDEYDQYVLSKMFVTSDFECEESSDRLTFIPKFSNAKMDFANPISYDNFYLELRPVLGFAEFKNIYITLTDFYDSNNVVKIRYGKQIVDQGLSTEYAALNINVNGVMQINYNTHYEGTAQQFYCKNGRVYIDTFIFNIGDVISNDKVFLSIEVEGAELEKSKIEIAKINNLVLGYARYDEIKPQLSYKKTCALYQDLNSEITIHPAVATDVLSAYVQGNLKMWVEGPNKLKVTALDGTVLEKGIDPTKAYTFKLTKEGRYKVNYEYTDSNGNKLSAGYNVYTGDNIAPTITLDGGYNENTVVKTKVGQVYKLQTYTATDNATPEEELWVTVLVKVPAGYYIAVKDGEIKCTDKGTYEIYYHCMDNNTNIASVSYTVVVE